jgi:HAD superfamily hydrolase (TIGR01509 family)
VAQAVIFDVDGTLLDTNELHVESWVRVFRRHGQAVEPQSVRAQMGKGGDQLMPALLPKDLVAREGEAISKERVALFLSEYIQRARPFPGVRPLFERLAALGRTRVLATSAKQEELDRYLGLLGLGDLVDDSVTSGDAEKSKPHPDIFAAALGKLAPLGADDVVVVGDSPFDAEAAGKIGLRTVGVLCGGFPEEVLRRAGCAAIFRDPAHLLAELERSPLA